MQVPIDLIVGLGNPGREYANTRHNAGAWFVERLAAAYDQQPLKNEAKFSGSCGAIELHGRICRLLIPSTYMNLSGQSVRALADFYKIPVHAILVAHDELDFAPGTVRIKYAGGPGGHNGVSDIIRHLNTPEFYRLRLGIGHPRNLHGAAPGDRADVTNYVLSRPPTQELTDIYAAIDRCIAVYDDLVQGNIAQVTQHLHQNSV